MRENVASGHRRCSAIAKARGKIPGKPRPNDPRANLTLTAIHEDTNPRYHKLIKAFDALTGCGVLVNTSFNVRGEPIVCTPEDAYRCFMRTEMDYLVLENYLLAKTDQPEWEKDDSWQDDFELD